MLIERVPRRADFCGCPPCGLCYVWVGDDPAPTFEQTMKEIYKDKPAPQTPEEYELGHAAAYLCRQELDYGRKGGMTFEEEESLKHTRVQVEDLLKQARKPKVAPKPLNTRTLDDIQPEKIAPPVPQPVQQPVMTPQAFYLQQQAYIQQQQLAALAQQNQYYTTTTVTGAIGGGAIYCLPTGVFFK